MNPKLFTKKIAKKKAEPKKRYIVLFTDNDEYKICNSLQEVKDEIEYAIECGDLYADDLESYVEVYELGNYRTINVETVHKIEIG